MTKQKKKLSVSLFLQFLLFCSLGFALGTISRFDTLRFFLQHSSTPPPPSSMVNHTPAAEKQPGEGGGDLGEFHELREVMHDMKEEELLWRASMTVSWGGMNMMEAERRLLANALLDFSNQRFVLLSESCIPLFDFPTVYSYLINSSRVHVESKDVPGHEGRGRFPARFRPRLQPQQWRKGSQWFEVDREVAVAVVADRDYFPLFQNHCSRCYSDEHYLPTLVGVRYPARTHNRSVTWVDWSRGGAHPAMYSGEHVTAELLETMRNGSSCNYNGRPTRTCFLFARKFSPSSLPGLMRFAPELMGFKSKALAK
ncbi:hypothetical protein ZIOFF_002101 [Zingiber officinale]|uniref:Core-2/I-branching beta-1,6-N-acetylglucosaminyltransferase family protein n=1 Tax=Zingiber officinale TaxID=94328 RepID=A0A8J5IPM9_ZINOF|nr:hypothetical protein ZIOFF_002101 [Zingiber officinale]